jgi:dTDP-4-dehydrorhamnose reductase
VDKAESDQDIARKINVDAIQVLAEAAKKVKARLVHYSTDYVFDGAKTAPYQESDQTGPLNVYGKTKLAGDKAILASGCECLIFRTSWVFATYGKNFINTILRLAQQRESLSIVADQQGAPTSAGLIADVTALCLYRIMTEPDLGSIVNDVFHLTSGGGTTWFEYARHILIRAEEHGIPLQMTADRITPITSVEYPVPAKRPLNSILDTGKLTATFGLVMPMWQQHADRTLQEIFRNIK